MEYKHFDGGYWVRIDRGEEIMDSLKVFAHSENIRSASVSGIGAVGNACIGLYDTEAHRYIQNTFKKDMEIVSLLGSISEKDGEVYLHLHIGLADETGAMVGGHLTRAVVSGTCEIWIALTGGPVLRRYDPGIGLNRMEFSDSPTTIFL
jgi:predicted DNA-binding protein with PD1-like motif